MHAAMWYDMSCYYNMMLLHVIYHDAPNSDAHILSPCLYLTPLQCHDALTRSNHAMHDMTQHCMFQIYGAVHMRRILL